MLISSACSDAHVCAQVFCVCVRDDDGGCVFMLLETRIKGVNYVNVVFMSCISVNTNNSMVLMCQKNKNFWSLRFWI